MRRQLVTVGRWIYVPGTRETGAGEVLLGAGKWHLKPWNFIKSLKRVQCGKKRELRIGP